MKQVIQDLKSGKILLDQVPPPALRPGGILIRNCVSLVSSGTERALMKLARKSLLSKARERPDLVRKVLAKLRRDGLGATVRAVKDRLEGHLPLGYSACGLVTGLGRKVQEFHVGQLVACGGAGYANHAELNYIPRLLAVTVPANVTSEAAAYATVGAVALQGMRNADVRAGETVVVIGLGLIGQLACQLLAASGCRIVGVDRAPARTELAQTNGAELVLAANDDEAESRVRQFTRGRGADAVLIAAAASDSEPVALAARLGRDRARIVMIGVTGMDLPRRPYYQKELTFVVSRSYGPGRYDRQYEEYGHDYPVGHVRWTEQRNIEAFLDLAAAGAIQPERCTTHRISIDDALQAFELVLHGREPSLGVVLTYPGALEPPREAETAERIALRKPTMRRPSGKAGISLIGAGNFARSVHLPNLCKMREVELRGVCDASGVVAASTGKKFGFAYCASVETELCEDPETDLVIIATSHSGHAGAVCRALAAGKAVFVEKPLAITFEQLWQVREVITASSGRLMVGFNRRFSPLAVELKDFIGNRGPILAQYRCNAGPLPAEHWMAEPAEGGRILGEACHFLDFFAFLTGAEPQRVYAAGPLAGRDDSLITVTYSDGSVCQLAYVSMGPSAYSKERVEVFASGRAGVIDDFWRLELYDDGGRRRRRRLLKANKGHFEELNACVAAVRSGGDMPIAWKSLFETTLASLAAVRSSQLGRPVLIGKLKPPGKPESEGCNAPIPIR